MRTIKFTALLLAITAIVSCQKENTDLTYNSDPTAVKISAGVGSPFTRSNPLEDGATSAAFKTGDVVSVSAEDQDDVKYTLNGTTWSPESGKYLKWNTATMTFSAYYPVGANNASMTSFDLPTDQASVAQIEKADYMTYTSPSAEAKAANISLALARKTARVVVSTTFNDQYATGYTVESITVGTNTNGYASGLVKSGTATVSMLKHTDGKCYALLSPTTANGNATFFTVTVKKTADNSTEDLTVKGIPALTAGNSYAYTVTVGKNTLAITNVTVSDWTSGDVIPGGEATVSVDVNPITHTLTVNKEGALQTKDITDALAGGTKLNVAGALSNADIATIAAYSSSGQPHQNNIQI